MYDYHLHTDNSGDCHADILLQCEAAWKAGLSEICFTDHIDLLVEGEEFTVDENKLLADIERARKAFPHLVIRLGLELGDDEPVRQRTKDFANRLPLDFVLLSRHMVDGVDPYTGDKYFSKYAGRKEAYGAYIAAVLRSVMAWDSFSSLAHLGYVCKQSPYIGERALTYKDAPDEIDAILRRIIHIGAALECNTSGYISAGVPIAGPDIFRRYFELGGELVTLGSDGHRPDRVAQFYPRSMQMLREMGLRYIATYDRQKLIMKPL